MLCYNTIIAEIENLSTEEGRKDSEIRKKIFILSHTCSAISVSLLDDAFRRTGETAGHCDHTEDGQKLSCHCGGAPRGFEPDRI